METWALEACSKGLDLRSVKVKSRLFLFASIDGNFWPFTLFIVVQAAIFFGFECIVAVGDAALLGLILCSWMRVRRERLYKVTGHGLLYKLIDRTSYRLK